MQPNIPRSFIVLAFLLATACDGGDESRATADPQRTAGANEQRLGGPTPMVEGDPDGRPVRTSASPSSSTTSGSEAARGQGDPGRESTSGGAATPADGDGRSSASAPTSPPAASDANDILLRAERAYAQVRSMQADFVQRVFVPLLETTQHSRGTIYHRSPDRFLMRFSDPPGDVIVADGRYVWMYYPSTDEGQVMRAPLAEGGQQADLYREFLSDASRRYAATWTGAESVGGRQAQALTLVPRGASPYTRVRIWVDDEDSLVRRFEITEENGTIRNLEMSGLRSNVSIADDLFRFTPPQGVQVHDF